MNLSWSSISTTRTHAWSIFYDIENVWGPDNDFWLELADSLGARVIIDLGCGTGLLTRALASGERVVIGVDPSSAMLAVARKGPGADRVRWIQGDASALGAIGADLALMTGNVAQVFLEDEAWEAALRSLHAALRPGGRLAFDSRNPDAREWESWTKESTHQRLETPHGPVETWLEVVSVEGGKVRIEGHNLFIQSGELVVAPSTLRFRGAAEIARSLERAGFVVEHIYGDWRRGPLRPESLSIVTIARRDGHAGEGP